MSDGYFMSENAERLSAYLSELFEKHGLPCTTAQDGWVLPHNELPALRARWFTKPEQYGGVLSVQALTHDSVLIEECFGGLGVDAEALHDALGNFTLNAFHVFLAALWQMDDPEQLSTESWSVNDQRYTAYIGNFGTRRFNGGEVDIPDDLFAAIETTIKAEPLTGDIHWFRLFFANAGGDFTFEALKDNDVWENGLRCLQNMPWKASKGYYSVRLFVILRRAAESAQ